MIQDRDHIPENTCGSRYNSYEVNLCMFMDTPYESQESALSSTF